MASQHRNDTSELALAIVEALVPAPPIHVEECYALVDQHLEVARKAYREMKKDNARLSEVNLDYADQIKRLVAANERHRKVIKELEKRERFCNIHHVSDRDGLDI